MRATANGRYDTYHQRRYTDRDDLAAAIRPLCRAFGPLLLRWTVDWQPAHQYPAAERVSERSAGGPEGLAGPDAALAGRMLCRPLPLARRHRSGSRAPDPPWDVVWSAGRRRQ